MLIRDLGSISPDRMAQTRYDFSRRGDQQRLADDHKLLIARLQRSQITHSYSRWFERTKRWQLLLKRSPAKSSSDRTEKDQFGR